MIASQSQRSLTTFVCPAEDLDADNHRFVQTSIRHRRSSSSLLIVDFISTIIFIGRSSNSRTGFSPTLVCARCDAFYCAPFAWIVSNAACRSRAAPIFFCAQTSAPPSVNEKIPDPRDSIYANLFYRHGTDCALIGTRTGSLLIRTGMSMHIPFTNHVAGKQHV
jgi:hypothetical protein